MKRIITYGTFDLLHFGHIRLLKRAKMMGDYLIVAISTDNFNSIKGKKPSYYDYKIRKEMVEAIRFVDLVIPETDWGQKKSDIARYEIDTVVMGDDWKGDSNFEELKELCDVKFLPRTAGTSTNTIKKDLKKY